MEVIRFALTLSILGFATISIVLSQDETDSQNDAVALEKPAIICPELENPCNCEPGLEEVYTKNPDTGCADACECQKPSYATDGLNTDQEGLEVTAVEEPVNFCPKIKQVCDCESGQEAVYTRDPVTGCENGCECQQPKDSDAADNEYVDDGIRTIGMVRRTSVPKPPTMPCPPPPPCAIRCMKGKQLCQNKDPKTGCETGCSCCDSKPEVPKPPTRKPPCPPPPPCAIRCMQGFELYYKINTTTGCEEKCGCRKKNDDDENEVTTTEKPVTKRPCPPMPMACRCMNGYETYFKTNPKTGCKEQCGCRKIHDENDDDEHSHGKKCPKILRRCKCARGLIPYYKIDKKTGCRNVCGCRRIRIWDSNESEEFFDFSEESSEETSHESDESQSDSDDSNHSCPLIKFACRCKPGFEQIFKINRITGCREGCGCRMRQKKTSSIHIHRSSEDNDDLKPAEEPAEGTSKNGQIPCTKNLKICKCPKGYKSYPKANPLTGCQNDCGCKKHRHFEEVFESIEKSSEESTKACPSVPLCKCKAGFEHYWKMNSKTGCRNGCGCRMHRVVMKNDD